MKHIDFQSMSIDQLWELHETLHSVLAAKVETEKRQLEKRIAQLGRTFGAPSSEGSRRPYPKVSPKFQNPEQPSETWSGRGKQPRWVDEVLQAGRTLDDCRISSGTSLSEA